MHKICISAFENKEYGLVFVNKK